MSVEGFNGFNERVQIVVHGLPLSKSTLCRKSAAHFWKLASAEESVCSLGHRNRDSRKASRLEVFGKLLISTIRRADSDTKHSSTLAGRVTKMMTRPSES